MKRKTMVKLASVLTLACACFAATPVNAQDSEPQAGTRKVLTINGVEFPFRLCLPGTVTIGSPASEGERRQDNEAQRRVTLDGFLILETEVTQEMWQSVMGTNPSWFSASGGGSDKVSGLDTSRFPVERVSWRDCQVFVEKLNALNVAPKGLAFRLPTEAEWEYACRAGTTGPYNVDGSSLDALGWYNGNSGERTRAVGGKRANAWGLYDMHGNVFEWCADRTSDQEIMLFRELRGGCWLSDAELCRSAKRLSWGDTSTNMGTGFRFVLASYESAQEQQAQFELDYEEQKQWWREANATANRMLSDQRRMNRGIREMERKADRLEREAEERDREWRTRNFIDSIRDIEW